MLESPRGNGTELQKVEFQRKLVVILLNCVHETVEKDGREAGVDKSDLNMIKIAAARS